MRKNAALAIALGILLTAVGLWTPSAYAATSVTEANVDQIVVGEPKADVQALLGTAGFRLYTEPNAYGTRIVKMYNGDGDELALVTYFRPTGGQVWRTVEAQWCHDNLTCS